MTTECIPQPTFLFETKVSSVKNKKIILADGTELLSDFTIIATEGNNLVEELEKQTTEWRSCYNLYFETDSKVNSKPLIGLIPEKEALINNIFYNSSLVPFIKDTDAKKQSS